MDHWSDTAGKPHVLMTLNQPQTFASQNSGVAHSSSCYPDGRWVIGPSKLHEKRLSQFWCRGLTLLLWVTERLILGGAEDQQFQHTPLRIMGTWTLSGSGPFTAQFFALIFPVFCV